MPTKITIEKLAKDNFFQQTEMIQFLVAENLALKTLLHEKGLLTPEEFNICKEKAEAMLKEKVDKHIEEWKKNNPEIVAMFAKADLQDH